MRHHSSRRLAVMALSLCLMAGLWGCGAAEGMAESDAPPESSDLTYFEGCGLVPGGIKPELLVNGVIYCWAGMAQERVIQDGQVYMAGTSDTYLPEGYTEAGDITSVTEGELTGERQLRAGFEAFGTVYTSETAPEAVYVLMTTDWFEAHYIRFVSDALGGSQLIAYQGRQYRFAVGRSDLSELAEELPDGCVLAGALRQVGIDAVPTEDLETNCPNDSYSYALEGREVYWDPADPSVLYLYERQYWRGGDHPAYRVCHLWSE